MRDHDTWQVNGIDLAVTIAGSGPLVVLAHGFPDLAITWRHQVPALVEAGYRVVAPDMRGYGRSSRPSSPDGYDSDTVGADLIALLDHEQVERAHFVGHDWGAASVWPLGLTHPERVLSLTGLSVPYTVPAPVAPTQIFRNRFGDDFYMLKFQEKATPEAMLERDVTRTLVAVLSGRVDQLDSDDVIGAPAWLPDDVLDTYVREFERTGFGGGLNYYRNIDANWRLATRRDRHRIEAPSLFVTGTEDPISAFMPADRSARGFRRLRSHTVSGAGHWLHQEEPKRVTDLILDYLRSVDRRNDL
ncbi:epoxide hydrolase EphA [Acrocarpospora macrocephala]|uniref:Epoxide hydrolase A n=1 Tax=Acrocarpospora macrocephala TaxID=150177 RepID=A0A5M3WQD3_9ACTN|nr:alpha/beta hydrolase [Acrocarpospora macrocephala]GES08943.1 epoxide hydrolase A [Acrocarpospora macrocephala]